MKRWYWLRYLITSKQINKARENKRKMTSPYCKSLFQEKPRHSSTQLPNSFRIQFDNTIFPMLFTNTSVAIYLTLSIFKKLMVTTNKHSKLVWRSFRFFQLLFLLSRNNPADIYLLNTIGAVLVPLLFTLNIFDNLF